MSTPDDNPYAAPQSDLTTTSLSVEKIPVAEEVVSRRAFAHLSTMELSKVLNASVVLFVIDWIYLIIGAFFAAVSILYFVTFYRMNNDGLPHGEAIYRILISGLAILSFAIGILVCCFFIKERYRLSRSLGVIIDILMLIVFALIIAYSYYSGVIAILLFIWPLAIGSLIAMLNRIRYFKLYDPDKWIHRELNKELDYRILHRVP